MKLRNLLLPSLVIASLQAATVDDLTFTLIGDIDGDGNINHLFSGFDRLRSAVGFRLLVACIGIGTTVIAMLPGGMLAAIGEAFSHVSCRIHASI